MSTQRRENRLRTTGCMERALDFGEVCQTPSAQFAHAHASGGTAPRGFFPAKLATNSLQSDYRSTRMVRLVSLNIRRGSPPSGAGRRATAVTLKSFGSSLPHIPSSSGLARLYLTLPWVPAASSCRTERYDGKRDLHIQHAA
jgi:hypothetical protein